MMREINRRVTIDAPAGRVWTVLADFGGVAVWAPDVLHSRLTSGSTARVGCERTCRVRGLGEVSEKVTAWEEGRGFDIEVSGPAMLKSAVASLQLTDAGTQTIVRVRARFVPGLGPLGFLMTPLFRILLGRRLSALLGGLKVYVETGEAVGRRVPKEALAAVA
jgi:uncharacterized membrane protein